MPPFLIQRKRIQISASTLAFLNRFRPSTLGKLIIEFMTSAFSKTFVFGVFARPHPFSKVSTLQGVFESLRFRGSRYPFSIVLVWTIGENAYKSMRFQPGLVWTNSPLNACIYTKLLHYIEDVLHRCVKPWMQLHANGNVDLHCLIL